MNLEVEGISKLIERISAFDREIYLDLQREVKAASNLIAKSAQGMIPGTAIESQSGRGWGAWGGRLDWSGVAAAIKPRFRALKRNGTKYAVGLVDTKSAPGAIFALAGSKTKSGPFTEQIMGTYASSYPRALGPAWTMHVDKARGEIQSAVDKAARRVSNG